MACSNLADFNSRLVFLSWSTEQAASQRRQGDAAADRLNKVAAI
jgi:hypothetical protein